MPASQSDEATTFSAQPRRRGAAIRLLEQAVSFPLTEAACERHAVAASIVLAQRRDLTCDCAMTNLAFCDRARCAMRGGAGVIEPQISVSHALYAEAPLKARAHRSAVNPSYS